MTTYNLLDLINSIETDFKDLLLEVYQENQEYFQQIEDYLNQQSEDFEGLAEIYPPNNLIFNTFNKFNIEDLKVVIIGQDPYHGPNQAMGLSFSVPESQKIPPSLKNIYKELSEDLELDLSERNGDLTSWTEQGVLLLNTALTVRQSKANSHSQIWKDFTRLVLTKLSSSHDNIIFMLWGNHAKGFKPLINDANPNHHYLESNHPSPLSANRGGWFGCKHFSRANELLVTLKKNVIDW